MTEQGDLLTVRELSKSYRMRSGLFGSAEGSVRAVDRVSFSVKRGGIFGLVGESGSGKTTIARMVVRVVEPDGGAILSSGAESGTVASPR